LKDNVVHDGVVFIDQAENQKQFIAQQKHKHSNAQQKQKQTVNQLPNLHLKDIQDGVKFLDVVENSTT